MTSFSKPGASAPPPRTVCIESCVSMRIEQVEAKLSRYYSLSLAVTDRIRKAESELIELQRAQEALTLAQEGWVQVDGGWKSAFGWTVYGPPPTTQERKVL